MGFCRVSYRNAFIPLVALMALFSCSTYAVEVDRGIQVQMSKAGERVDDSWQMDFKNYYYLAWDAVTNKEIGASGFRVGRVARAGGHEVKPTEMKEDGAPEASTVAEAASHGFDLLDASIE